MNAEQLTEALRKHAKAVLLPSVAQAIVEELGMQETQPVAKVAADVDSFRNAEIDGIKRALGMAQSAVALVSAERDALRKALVVSCDDEREQFWEAGPGGGCQRALDAEHVCDALRAELDALKRDAARYQWVRTQAPETWDEIGREPTSERVDSHIDAAMKEQQK